ncbi:3-alpha-(or 20-beta)-hydroxysteroid dehydrogenase [Solibacillus isronensis B3W22]|uniref:3-alpha-(Or 20-beta)-hydroxysteroid dehydrogenase n=1 Tax=Solibacillus isronensis B3W22 TaxID=1224748 RepID=K1L3H2_9BACL|nr:glucose 1-dehydrogenase [Solibacillus isronensis]AMO86597.1 3-alpha-hydroxysteroid dehydrogenase [Solibacillus silvestris]EKB45178.1 3-alpha-(or 20-beta)-hydroxysteroid dehydrogenase [Solibacillus isronensis B3W22]
MGKLEGKVAIITGAARGQGAAHAKAFIEEGAKVAITDILSEEGAQLAEQLGAENCKFYKHDVTNLKEWESIVSDVENTFGPVNILINNAGIGLKKSIVDMTEEEYRKIIDVNQVSVFLGMKSVIPSMLKMNSGSIVNISSIAGLLGSKDGSVAYDASKFAVTGMTKSIGLEMAHTGIRVNSVHPGIIMTPMVMTKDENPTVTDSIGKLLNHVPMKRGATPEEVTKLVLFLASDDSSYSTASEFVIDGGLTANRYG